MVAKDLVRVFKAKDVDGYAALLADDVQVFEDGRQVAGTKERWLAKFGAKLKADGVYFKLNPGYIGANRILFIEYFSSHASWDTAIPRDCCSSYDAVSYEVRKGKIALIRRLTGGSIMLNEAGERSDLKRQ